MNPGEISRTARLVAACRVLATEGHPVAPVRCHDPQARWFVDDDALAAAARFPNLVRGIALRTLWLDEQLRAVGPGAQIVILGAGFDTRALRLGLDAPFFEIDLPAMLAQKAEVLAAHGAAAPRRTAIPVDLAHEPFAPALRAHPAFDPAAPTCVVWEGVTYYLPEAAVDAGLAQIASLLPQGGRFLFDWVRARFIESLRAKTEAVPDLASRWGEPMIFGFTDLRAALAAHDLFLVEEHPTEDLLPRYGHPPVEKRSYAGRMALATRLAPTATTRMGS